MKKGALFTTVGSIIILIISFIAFVLPSQLGSGQESTKKVFGKYKSREIVYEKDSDLVNNLQSIQNNFYNTYGREHDNSEFYQNFYNAFKTTVSQYAYEEAAKKAGYVVSEETVNRELRSYFVDETGNFSKALYDETDKDAIVRIKQQMLQAGYSNRVTEDLFGTTSIGESSLYGLKESDAELDFLSNFDSNQRAFNMISLDKSTYPDEEVLAFANKNANLFTKYNLSVITFSDKAAADKAAKKLANGTSFEEVAKEGFTSFCDSEGKLIYPYYYNYRLSMILNDSADLSKITALSKDAVSDVIELTDGFAIFKNLDAEEKANFEDEATFKDVRTYVSSYESPMIEDYFIAKANEFKSLATSTSFDNACAELGLTKIDVPAFSLNYGGSSFGTSVNSTLPGLTFADTNETFLKTAFTLKENEVSSPIVMTDQSAGCVIVLQYVPTTQEDSSVDMKAFLAYQIQSYDNIAAANNLLKSKFVTDNFRATYYGY